MTKTKQETERIFLKLNNQVTHISYVEWEEIKKLRRLAKKLHRQYEAICNGATVQDIVKAERKSSDLEFKIREIVTNLGLNCFFQRDPRGGTLYIGKKYLNNQNYYTDGVFVAQGYSDQIDFFTNEFNYDF